METDGAKLDLFDRQILHFLQYEFPVSPQPYRDLAGRLGTTEDAVLARVRELYAQGYIRKLGASINSSRIGYSSMLVALRVAPERIGAVADLVNGFTGVTHNYLREGDYNMWFTAIAPDRDCLAAILETVAAAAGVEALMPLPAKRVFKVSVKFPMIAG